MKIRGLGPLKLGPVHQQFDYDRMMYWYYVKFGGSFILIGTRYLEPSSDGWQ